MLIKNKRNKGIKKDEKLIKEIEDPFIQFNLVFLKF
jgi:hypothetical protein